MYFLIIIFIALAFLFGSRTITTVIHEMGHAIAGLALSNEDITIYIGSYGDPKKGLHFTIGRLTVHFKLNLLLWNHGLCTSGATEMSAIQGFIFVLAGPVTSFLIGIVSLILFLNHELHGAVRLGSLFLLISSLVDFLQNITPNARPVFLHDGTMTYNDGQSLKIIMEYRGVYKQLISLQQYFINKEFDKGSELFEKIYSNKPNVKLLAMGSSLYIQSKQYEKVIELYKGIEDTTQLSADDFCNYSLAYSYTNNHEEAFQLYTKALQINDRSFYALINRGYTLNILGRYEEAIIDFDKANIVFPSYAYTYSNRGLSKIKLGNMEEGLADIETSIALNDSDPYAYKSLGIYHFDNGEINEALNQFKKAKDLNQDTHGLQEQINLAEQVIKNQKSTPPNP